VECSWLPCLTVGAQTCAVNSDHHTSKDMSNRENFPGPCDDDAISRDAQGIGHFVQCLTWSRSPAAPASTTMIGSLILKRQMSPRATKAMIVVRRSMTA